MRVRIGESGDDGRAVQVNDRRRRRRQRSRLGVRADEDYSARAYSQRRNDRASVIDRVYVAVGDNEIS